MEWFQENPPISPIAKIKLSELLVRNNFIDEGAWILKKLGFTIVLLTLKKSIF